MRHVIGDRAIGIAIAVLLAIQVASVVVCATTRDRTTIELAMLIATFVLYPIIGLAAGLCLRGSFPRGR